MDTVDKIEEYLESLEEYFFSSFHAATTDLPNIHEAVNRLWIDISRYGPGMPSFPEVHIPGLGEFQVPPPPPPPSPPPSWLDRSIDWVGHNPWKASGVVISVVGAGLLVGYGATQTRKRNNYRVKSQPSNERRQVVVVLGGDTPFGLPLILDLEKKGYIVIASVSNPESVETLEQKCEGYVRALVLDPHEPATIPVFLRSLKSTLSRRFPITAAGDPFASPSSHPYIHSVISLLTLPHSTSALHAPLEHMSLRDDYLPYLSATHIAPLQVIQALLPLLRTIPARSRDQGSKSIIVCLPATDARVGLPFASIQAMSAASTLRGVEVLRREINIAALTDPSESMKNVKVIVVDVGAFDTGVQFNTLPQDSIYKAMENWSASEKATYGPAFTSIALQSSPPTSPREVLSAAFKHGNQYGIPRRPTDISVFVDNLVTAVSGGRIGPTFFGLHIGLGRIKNWIRGERFSIGAGASTYKIASYLPTLLLDALLNIPHFLISVRNSLLPVQPYIHQPPARRDPTHVPLERSTQPEIHGENNDSETSSEADVESVSSLSGDGSGVENSWISLKTAHHDPESEARRGG